MKYVLQHKHTYISGFTGILYVPDDVWNIGHALCLGNAKVFGTKIAAQNYHRWNNYSDQYQVIKVTDKELFKAKLAGI